MTKTTLKNRDEFIFLHAVREATQRCGTFGAQVVYVKEKLERVQQARLAKAKAALPVGESLRMIDRHRAQHYALALPWEVLEDEVSACQALLEGLEDWEVDALLGHGGEE